MAASDRVRDNGKDGPAPAISPLPTRVSAAKFRLPTSGSQLHASPVYGPSSTASLRIKFGVFCTDSADSWAEEKAPESVAKQLRGKCPSPAARRSERVGARHSTHAFPK